MIYKKNSMKYINNYVTGINWTRFSILYEEEPDNAIKK